MGTLAPGPEWNVVFDNNPSGKNREREVKPMSLYYFTTRNINKSKQSAVACAAYRSGQSLYSEEDMETKFYGEREVLPETFIMAPDHAPQFVTDRERLWNEVEKIENRINSRLSREVLTALPIELSNDQQNQMLKEFIKENFIDKGMVADIAIHRDKEQNPHAHIMLTTRAFNQDGTWAQKKKREYVFDDEGNSILDKNGKKKFKTVSMTDWNDKDTLKSWRKNYADKVNEYYKKNNLDIKVSHESYKDQGLDKLPKQRLSRIEYDIENREKITAEQSGLTYVPKTENGKANHEIELRNKITEKITSLSDYREKLQNDELNKLNSIRKNSKLSNDDWNSLKVVADRLGGFVDINSAKDNLSKLDNWKKSLDYKDRMLKAEETVLFKAKEFNKTNPSKTLFYGIIPIKFEEDFKIKSNELRKQRDKLNHTFDTYNEIRNHSVKAYEIQKNFTNQEFNYLYPNYADEFKDSNIEVMRIKEKYVNHFRESGSLESNIIELDSNKHILKDDYVNLKSFLNDWKEVKNSLVILERTKEKRKSEYNNNYKEYNADKIYKSAVKYTESKEQLKLKEEEKLSMENKLKAFMVSRYPDSQEKIIDEIPSELKSKILTLHINYQQSGKLSKDLKIVQENESQVKRQGENTKQNKSEFQNKDDDQISSEVKSASSSLFDSLINMAQEQENSKTRNDSKHKNDKTKKHYRKFGEHEID